MNVIAPIADNASFSPFSSATYSAWDVEIETLFCVLIIQLPIPLTPTANGSMERGNNASRAAKDGKIDGG